MTQRVSVRWLFPLELGEKSLKKNYGLIMMQVKREFSLNKKIEMNKWETGKEMQLIENRSWIKFSCELFCCALRYICAVLIVACLPACMPASCGLCILAHVKMHSCIEFIIVFCNWIVAWLYVVNNSSCHKLNETRPKQERTYSYAHTFSIYKYKRTWCTEKEEEHTRITNGWKMTADREGYEKVNFKISNI